MERTRASIPAFVLSLALGAGAQPGQTSAEPVPVTGPDAELILAAGVSGDRMVQAVRALCAFGSRTGGSANGDRAAELAAARLQEAGVECSAVAGEAVEVWEGSGHAWIHEDGGESAKLESARPMRGSPPVDGTFRVLSGDEAGSRDVAGAVVFGVHESPGRQRFAAGGAVAEIFGLRREEASGPGGIPLDLLRGAGPPALPVIVVDAADSDRLEKALGSGRPVTATLSLGSSVRSGRPVSVVGRLGPADSGRRIVLAATLEAEGGGPGASDAAAVAVVLEIARVLSAMTRGRDVAPLPFEVVVMLNADRRPQVPVPWAPAGGKEVRGFEIRFRRIAASRRSSVHVRCSGDAPPALRAAAEGTLAGRARAGGFWRIWTFREGHMQGQRPPPPPAGLPCRLEVMTTPRTGMDPPEGWADDATDRSEVILTTADTPENAVLPDPAALERAARFALVLLERLREEKAW